MKYKNTKWFKKDGTHRKSPWRMYCQRHGCEKYIVLRWSLDALGNGGHMAHDKAGQGCDVRNQCYVCKEHQKEFQG